MTPPVAYVLTLVGLWLLAWCQHCRVTWEDWRGERE